MRLGEPSSKTIPEVRLSAKEVRDRAVTGAAVDALRGFGVRLISLVGTLVLARLLTPRDFGIIAVGATFVIFANFVADGGVGAVLIRRSETSDAVGSSGRCLRFSSASPRSLRSELRSCPSRSARSVAVTALMVVALPLTAVRAPGVILLERRLDYRPLALVEIIETDL